MKEQIEEIEDIKEEHRPSYEELKRAPENYIIIDAGYSNKYVLNHKAGIALLSAMKEAEYYDTSVYDVPVISPMERTAFSSHVISEEYYLNLKMSHLLKLNKK